MALKVATKLGEYVNRLSIGSIDPTYTSTADILLNVLRIAVLKFCASR